MKLQNTKLCVNCESLFEDSSSCPYCQSGVFVWLIQALGTTINPDMDEIDIYSLAKQASPASQAHVSQKDSFISEFTRKMMGGKSLGELRVALGSAGRGMIRVLTFGMVQ